MFGNFNGFGSVVAALAAAVFAANAMAAGGQDSNSPGLDAFLWLFGWLFC